MGHYFMYSNHAGKKCWQNNQCNLDEEFGTGEKYESDLILLFLLIILFQNL